MPNNRSDADKMITLEETVRGNPDCVHGNEMRPAC